MNFLVVLAVLAGGSECQEAQAIARQTYQERRYEQSASHFARAVAA